MKSHTQWGMISTIFRNYWKNTELLPVRMEFALTIYHPHQEQFDLVAIFIVHIGSCFGQSLCAIRFRFDSIFVSSMEKLLLFHLDNQTEVTKVPHFGNDNICIHVYTPLWSILKWKPLQRMLHFGINNLLSFSPVQNRISTRFSRWKPFRYN